MAYISLYRKYRPTTFNDLVGQNHIVRVLTNQIKSGTVSHAYLFTGTRGTGKTSVAKIFARAVNCGNNANGSPCNECCVCKELMNPNNPDVTEIDAASNNSVDDMRDLIEKIKYSAVVAKYKVYIIDEAHMLTPSAANALLKTLEEPPENVIFILATTEAHKILPTILSRCLRLDFRLLSESELIERLHFIYLNEGIEAEPDALKAIAGAGAGSVRDALSIADMCLSYAENNVLKHEDVLEVLGASDPKQVLRLIYYVFRGRVDVALRYVDDIASAGKSISLLARDILKSIRNVYLVSVMNAPEKTLNLPDVITANMRTVAIGTDSVKLLEAMEIMTTVESDMRYSSEPRIILENAIAKICVLQNNEEIKNRVALLEKQISELKKTGVYTAKRLPQSAVELMGEIAGKLRENKCYMTMAQLANIEMEKFAFDGDNLIIKLSTQSEVNTLTADKAINEIKTAARMLYDKDIQVKAVPDENSVNLSRDIDIIKQLFDGEITVTKKGGK